MLCAVAPDAPHDVVIAINDDFNLQVSWQLTNTNGSPVTNFKVHIKENSSDTYTLEAADCDGTQASVISAMSCIVTDTVFTAAPYSYTTGSQIYVKVSAVND
jgi:hypothetical protein